MRDVVTDAAGFIGSHLSEALLARAHEAGRTQADLARIGGGLGWAPQVSLEEGVERQWEWASARVAAA
jgi:nucleoside-diphosphate-sugar epimerase